MYDQAKHWQEAHLALCDDVYATSKGAFIDFEACLLSRIKLISILLDMKLYEDALEWSIDALNHLDDGDTYDVLVDQFAICCVYLGMDSDAVRELALKRLDEFGLFDSATSKGFRKVFTLILNLLTKPKLDLYSPKRLCSLLSFYE